MVKYVLRNTEKFIITDDLYENMKKEGNKFLVEEITLSDDEIKEYKRELYDYAWGKLKERADYDINILNELIDMEEPQAIQYEIDRLVTPNLFKSNNQREVYKTLYKQASRLADASINRYYDAKKAEQNKITKNTNDVVKPEQKNNENTVENDETLTDYDKSVLKNYYDTYNTYGWEELKHLDNIYPGYEEKGREYIFAMKNKNKDKENENLSIKNDDSESDIDSDKRLVFVKNVLSKNKIPLTNEQFQDIVGEDNIKNLINIYNGLYYCGASIAESKAKRNELKQKFSNIEEYLKAVDDETQKLFDTVTQKWWENVYKNIQKNKPNQVKILDKMMSTVKEEEDDYDLQQEFLLKGKAANKIIQRIKDIMRNVGKVNYVNYVFTNVPNLSSVKKYYLSELQTNASFSDDREMELKKIEEIRNADNSLFQQISKRLLVNGDINEYVKVIRYDDVLDGVFTVTKTERATTLGQQRIILTFTENSTREVMFVLVIEPTFGALKQLLKGLDVSGIKNAIDNLNKKL